MRTWESTVRQSPMRPFLDWNIHLIYLSCMDWLSSHPFFLPICIHLLATDTIPCDLLQADQQCTLDINTTSDQYNISLLLDFQLKSKQTAGLNRSRFAMFSVIGKDKLIRPSLACLAGAQPGFVTEKGTPWNASLSIQRTTRDSLRQASRRLEPPRSSSDRVSFNVEESTVPRCFFLSWLYLRNQPRYYCFRRNVDRSKASLPCLLCYALSCSSIATSDRLAS